MGGGKEPEPWSREALAQRGYYMPIQSPADAATETFHVLRYLSNPREIYQRITSYAKQREGVKGDGLKRMEPQEDLFYPAEAKVPLDAFPDLTDEYEQLRRRLLRDIPVRRGRDFDPYPPPPVEEDYGVPRHFEPKYLKEDYVDLVNKDMLNAISRIIGGIS